MVLNINCLFGADDVEIREDGVIDEDVIDAFTQGHCHAFALALHRAFGWELVGALWSTEIPSEDDWTEEAFAKAKDYRYRAGRERLLIPDHVLVRDEAGVLYDVTGRLTEGDACYSDVRSIPADFVEAACDGLYRPTEAEFASTFVECWAERHLS